MKIKITFIFWIICIGIGIQAQCYVDRHSTDIADAWLSCDLSASPNSANPDSHWIMYDLGGIHPIYDIHVWNMNHPDFLNFGFKELQLDYSQDGVNWTTAGTYSVPKAFASSFYEGYRGINLKGQQTRYLLFTGVSNYQGPCFGLGEIKAYTSQQSSQSWSLAMGTCESEGHLQSLSFGSQYAGTYSGPGVTDLGDGSFSFDPDIVGPGLYTIQFNTGSNQVTGTIEVYSCENRFCRDCPECDNFVQSEVDADPIQDNYYYADSINSMGAVRNFDNVYLRGEDNVTLQSGFEVIQAMDFVSEIRDCQTNLIRNPSFENGLTDWKTTIASGISATISTTTQEAYEKATSAYIDANSSTGDSWRLVVQQQNITLLPDQEYLVAFAIKSDHRSTINFRITGPSNIFSRDLVLDPFWNHFQFTFTAGSGVVPDGASLKFQMGIETGEFWIDHVRLEPLD